MSAIANRATDNTDNLFFRSSERVVRGGDGWYFLLRDAEQLGPYSNKEAAECHGNDFARKQNSEASGANDLMKLIRGEKIERTESISVQGWDQIPEVKRAV